MHPPGSRKPAVRAAAWAAVLLLALGTRALAGVDLPPVWHWSNPTPEGADLFGLASSQGTYVQVAEAGQIFTSDDLVSWTPQQGFTTASLQAATFFGGRCLIVGEAGTALFSDDLIELFSRGPRHDQLADLGGGLNEPGGGRGRQRLDLHQRRGSVLDECSRGLRQLADRGGVRRHPVRGGGRIRFHRDEHRRDGLENGEEQDDEKPELGCLAGQSVYGGG